MLGCGRDGVKVQTKRAQEILDKLPNPVFVADPTGNVLLSNPATPISFGLSLGEFLQLNVKDCVKKGFYDVSVALEAAEKHRRVSRVLTTRLGMVFVSTSTPIFDEQGRHTLTVTNACSLKEHEKREGRISSDEFEAQRRHLQHLFGHVFDSDAIVAESPVTRDLLVLANVVAGTDSTVMITGETGTGKELLARYIHSHSRRAQAPFIAVNGAALPDALAEAELFGYERGAFTGAKAEGYGGLFAAADGGTLFLDEVGELPLTIQAKLLRALDSGEVRRVGGTTTRRVNVRVVAATNRDLEEMVRDKTFRQDLFYRLNGFTLKIRPLRDRPEDITALAAKFWHDMCRKHDFDFELTQSFVRSLTSRAWPGNARELKHFVEGEVIRTQAQRSLSSLAVFNDLNRDARTADILELVEIGSPLKQVMSRIEENYIRYMLDACGGRVGATATRLGIYRTALHRKLKLYRDADSTRNRTN